MSTAIHNPALARIDDVSDNIATFVIEPLQAGYGNTLGNSLRRVLLSSIEGASIVAFKIEGVTHEFTTVPGVKEDVIDIMLNLKGVDFISHSEAPVELQISKKGAGEVKASDVKTDADTEVVNPDHVICTIDDPKKSINMTIVVENGRGYKTIEESSADRLHSDMISLDAMFNPVQRVRYKVDSTRVGQETDLDRLELTVETNGAISPRDAFEQAAAILVNQYTALAGSTTVVAAPALGQDEDSNDDNLNITIEDLGLSARTANALVNNDIRTVHDLVTLSEQDLHELKGFGSKAFEEVKEKLAELEF